GRTPARASRQEPRFSAGITLPERAAAPSGSARTDGSRTAAERQACAGTLLINGPLLRAFLPDPVVALRNAAERLEYSMTLRILLILGALSAFGPLAIDFYLPAFPALAKAFGTDVEHVQLSLASYFVGIALGQLAYGPLADRYGRRRPLLAGVFLFAVGSLACALAPSLEWLIGARFVQALGGCAGMVVARARAEE